MTSKYKNFTIDVFDDELYTPNSADNVTYYQFDYSEKSEYRIPSQHGIRISEDEEEISSAIIFGDGGGTTIHPKSYLVKDDTIFICCGDNVCSLHIPTLILNWQKKLDTATCFGIYEFDEDFIIHGELEISRLTKSGEIKWQFSGRDIFVSLGDKSELIIENSLITGYDYGNFKYILDGNGQEIKS